MQIPLTRMSASFIEKEIHEKQKHLSSPLKHETKSPKKENSDHSYSRSKNSLHGKIYSKAESKTHSESSKNNEIKLTDSPNKEKSQKKIATDVKPSTTSIFSPRKTRSRTASVSSPKTNANANKSSKIETSKANPRARSRLKLPQLDGAHDVNKATNKKGKSNANTIKAEESNSDSDFEPSPPKRIRPKPNLNKSSIKSKAKNIRSSKSSSKNTSIDRRIISSDDDEQQDPIEENTNHMNFWVEAYAEKEKKWVSIDPVKKKVDAIDFIRVCI